MNRPETMREAQKILGFVPAFLGSLPEQHVGPIWEQLRGLQLHAGEIPAKQQQLVMLGVAIHMKCNYCVDLHTELAKAFGTTADEIGEVALLAAHTAQWSSVLVGMQYDFGTFQREVRKIAARIGVVPASDGGFDGLHLHA